MERCYRLTPNGSQAFCSNVNPAALQTWLETHQVVVQLLGHGVPRLVVLNVAVVGVVSAVADAPAVVGHQDGRVGQVADEVVQGLVV